MDLTPIIEALRKATRLCRDVQHNSLRSLDKYSKDKNSKEPVTMADYGSQALLCRAIQQHFPDDAIISEEAGSQFMTLTNPELRAQVMNLLTDILDVNVTQDDVVSWLDFGKGIQAKRTWVIDPIDGTKGFINLRHYVIAVGIVEDGQPTGGLMAAPAYGDGVSGYDDGGMIFVAQDGKASKMPIAGGDAQPIVVSDKTDDLHIVQSFEKQHASKSRMAIVRENAGMADAKVSELDSMEKYALVATGDADAYLRLPNLNNNRPHMAWDHAAGVAIVQAAGGMATDVDGSPLIFSDGQIMPNRGMLVSNGKVHARLVAATQELLISENS